MYLLFLCYALAVILFVFVTYMYLFRDSCLFVVYEFNRYLQCLRGL